MSNPTIDAITVEVIRNALITAVAEMKQTVLRTAYSWLWKEAGDLSCGFLTRKCEIVAQGVGDIPVHMGTMPMSVEGVVNGVGEDNIEPEDVLWSNDPYSGNNHLPDFIMARPVFVGSRIIGYSAVRGHYVDIGGSTPGSHSTVVYDIHAEGVRILPVKIFKRGELNQDMLNVLIANTRNPTERLGDFRSQYAGCVAGERRFRAIVEKYGSETVEAAMEEILNHSERLMRTKIREVPDGTYEYTDYIDDDGIRPDPIKVCVKMTVDGDDLIVDLTGSDPQVPGAVNCPLSVTHSAVYYAIKTYLTQDPENPTNSGSYRPIQIIAPEGSIVNCRYPAPVIAGNTDSVYRVLDVLMGAIAQAVPERAVATGTGGACSLTMAGIDGRADARFSGRQFNWLEPNGSCHGAAYCQDGINGTRWGVGNGGNTPIEALELNQPLFEELYEIAQDVGGPGKYRGGNPLHRRIRALVDCVIVVCSERNKFSPWGLFGGKPGKPSSIWLERTAGERIPLPSKTDYIRIKAGDLVDIRMAGGGGYGDPTDRDPQKVLDDVIDGYVSLESAKRDHGVVLLELPDTPLTGLYKIDHEATQRLRAVMRESDSVRTAR